MGINVSNNSVKILVSQDGSRLTLEDGSTLYHFAPQRFNSEKQANVVPWMDEWPDYLKFWVKAWNPLATTNGKAEFEKADKDAYRLEDTDLYYFKRDGGPHDSKFQITFRGWSLFTYQGEHHPDQANGEVGGLWRAVDPNLIDLGHYVPPQGQGISGGP